jgi:ADP-ribose pyrophosphatase
MEENNGIFRLITREQRYQNPWISIFEEEAVHQTTGDRVHYHVVRYANPSVVAVVKHGTKILVEEIERYPIAAHSLELPAGGIEPGETAEEAAVREVFEETGITMKNAKAVYQFYPSDGTSDQLAYVVTGEYASGDIIVQTDELKNAYWMEKDALQKQIENNDIKDGYTLIALLRFA